MNRERQQNEEFMSELDVNMKTLRSNIELLDSDKDKEFARSLCHYYETYDKLSPKQAIYAAKFWQEVNSLGAEQAEPSRGKRVASPTPVSSSVAGNWPEIDCRSIIEMFDFASTKIKYPNVTIPITQYEKLKFHRMSATSRAPGNITVTDGGKFPDHKLYGEISHSGKFLWNAIIIRRDRWVVPAIVKTIDNFTELAAISGKETGFCCYCGLGLTNKHSLAVGYGPICAANYGLPWGEDGKVTELEDVL